MTVTASYCKLLQSSGSIVFLSVLIKEKNLWLARTVAISLELVYIRFSVYSSLSFDSWISNHSQENANKGWVTREIFVNLEIFVSAIAQIMLGSCDLQLVLLYCGTLQGTEQWLSWYIYLCCQLLVRLHAMAYCTSSTGMVCVANVWRNMLFSY